MSRISSSRKNHRGFTTQEVTTIISNIVLSKNLEVVHFEVKAFSSEKLGYLGVHELLTVKICDRASKNTQTFTFFVKSLAPTNNDFDMMIFNEEKHFFSKVMPRLLRDECSESWAAKCYYARDDLLVLEDLRSQGFKVIGDLLQDWQLRAAIVSVARLHAASMLLERESQESLDKIYSGFFKEKVFLNDDDGFAWKWLVTGIEVVEAVAVKLGLEPKHASVAYHMMLESVKLTSDQRNVICHCDLWSNNMMFKDNNDGTGSCKLVDFQLVGYTCYAIDVMQLLYLNTSKVTRQRLEKELFELYHSELKENLQRGGLEEASIIRLEEVFKDLENKRICGIVAAVQNFPIALLNKELALEYCKNVDELEKYMYVTRKDFVLRAMTLDEGYRNRIEESVKELMDFMQNIGTGTLKI